MKTLFYNSIFVLLLLGCDKTDNVKSMSNYLDSSLDISFVNEKGEDLLSKSTENFIEANKIRIFIIMEDDTKKYLYDSNWDSPNHTLLYFNDRISKNMLRIFPNDAFMKETISYIEFGNGDIDTIRCLNAVDENTIFFRTDTVYYNKIMVMDRFSAIKSENYITIKK